MQNLLKNVEGIIATKRKYGTSVLKGDNFVPTVERKELICNMKPITCNVVHK